MLAAWGRLVHRFRWLILILSGCSLAAAVWALNHGGQFETVFIPSDAESGRAFTLMQRELPANPPSFGLIFSSRTLRATDPAFRAEVERAIAPLRRDPRVNRVRTAYDPSPSAGQDISRDGHRTLVTVELKGRASDLSVLAQEVYPDLRAEVRSRQFEVLPEGQIPINHDVTYTAKHDIERAELIALPLLLLLLVLVFGSVLAAAIPLAVGLLAVTGGMAAIFQLARGMSVSVYASNIVFMIGLGVAIDYSLFIVSRFREEIREHPIAEALARTLATAGRVILFSGCTVAIGLLGLIFLRVSHLGSMGVAGTIVVGLALLYGLTFLPALLAVLGRRVDALRLGFLHPDRPASRNGFWHRVSTVVMRRPWAVLLPLMAFLLLLGAPFLHIHLGPGDVSVLPQDAESRRGDAVLRQQFPRGETTLITVVLHYPDDSPLSARHVGQAYDLSRWLATRRGIARVESPVAPAPSMTRAQAQQLFALPAAQRPPALREALERGVGRHIIAVAAYTPLRAGSREARALVQSIRTSHPSIDGEVLVTGQTAINADLLGILQRKSPLAIGLILLVTYLVLLPLLGSVVLPFKAVIMNLLSITASYGALVWLFQDGHLARWLHVTPGPIEMATPMVMFCLLFGLSMDYEVLLLSRVREEYERTGDNTAAVALGLKQTGRLITGAAAIMAVVLFAFGLADMVVIKAIGIGMGIAVVVDATIVRALLVPATMRLLGEWNWWIPAPLRRFIHAAGLDVAAHALPRDKAEAPAEARPRKQAA